ncbi:MAG: Ig-like domain-containing protein [Taibaiella sp.]|nr:Ig-like domain-containing protein [Taibaiella sp.]
MINFPKLLANFLLVLSFFAATVAHAQISGHLVVCRGASRTTLTGTPAGGTWASGDATRATINTTTGEVAGVAAGTATITYTDPSSTVYTAVVTVNGYVMGNIGFSMGNDIRCTGGVPATCTVSPLIGNNWTSSDPTIASINTGGSVVPSATNAGTVTISYRHGYGNCYVTRGMTVNPTPTVSLTNPVCAGVIQTATGTPAGGTWMSSNLSVGTINSTTGVLSSFIGGGTYIRYTIGSCLIQPFLTVSAGVAAFGGSTTICVGNTSNLTCATVGGSWSSSDPSVATIGSSTGVVTGMSVGTSTISYVVGSSCFRTAVVTVNAGPSASSGPDEVCVGQTIALTNATGGGTWSSSGTARATVTTYGGTVTGVGAGTVNISYRVGGACAAVKTITVNAAMASITGGPYVCEGTSVTLTHAMGAGTWTASNSNATVDLTTGDMTGVTAGSVNITYTSSPGCVKAQMMIVKPTPAAISGDLAVCPGTTTALSSASGGGTWSSGTTSVAMVSGSGLVTGVSGGTATISYTIASWGCSATAVVTVSSTGGGISGSTTLCLGSSSTLTSSPGGGTWSSSNTSVATIGSSSGVVMPVGVGTASISYSMAGGCLSTTVVTVSETPSAISGPTGVCMGGSVTLSNSISGGTWSSGTTAVATVGSASGVVTAVSTGTSVITYITGPGCFSTVVVTVSSAPGTISGPSAVCTGSSISLTNSATGGIWSSASPSVATVGSLSGIVSGITSGTTSITYSLGGGCEVSTVVTVTAGPSSIGGTLALCVGLSSTLTNSTSGGTWSSSNTSVATVGSATGGLSAVAPGTATITYTTASSCFTTVVATVTTGPGAISGASGLCIGAGTTLTVSPGGGTWSTSDAAVANVGTTGFVTAVAPGTASISYSLGTGCVSTTIVTVLVTPAAISGSASTCVGVNTVLSSTGGSYWTSSNTTIAAVGSSSGVVAGVSAGTATISVLNTTTGCFKTVVVTVNALPAAITGTAVVCVGSTTTLSTTSTGGSWLSSNTSVATIGSGTGVVSGVAAGTSVVSYVSAAGCLATRVVTVNASTATIGGTLTLCTGTSSGLGASVGGGTWSSSTTSVATIGTSGLVSAVSAGTSVISYVVGGCLTTTVVTVVSAPSAISGTATVCAGATTTFSSSPGGGSWTSSASSVATVSGSGVVTGVSGGTSTITYSIGTSCVSTRVVTVLATPASISGTASICVGGSSALSSATGGGSWSSSATSIATVGSTGIVTAVSAGTSVISYVVAGCLTTTVVTVVSAPSAISGAATVCAGATTTFSSSPGGGSWTSSASSIATVSGSGVVTGVSGGTSTITYSIGTSCLSTRVVTVLATPAAISGTASICVGGSSALSSATSGGSWSSSATSIATVGSTGIVAGVAAGTVTIYYAVSGCATTLVVTVLSTPSSISGTLSLCDGTPTTLVSFPSGGTWSSSNIAIAAVSSGVVTGLTIGTATISYVLATSCYATAVVTVTTSPAAIAGTAAVCTGYSTTLSSATSGGAWSSSNTSVASVGTSTGTVTGAAAGTAAISYTVAGCATIRIVTVYANPSISGGLTTCVGITTTLSSVAGGSWSSTNTSVATVDGSGVVTGVAVGTSTISYVLSTGCFTTVVVTVGATSGGISGTLALCPSGTSTLTSTVSGGTWSSSNPARATIDATTGAVSAISAGTVTISYTISAGCTSIAVLTVNAAPNGVTGTAALCTGTTTTLASSTGGGTWVSSNTAVGTISTGGVFSGLSVGTSDITYTVSSTGCYTTRTVSVNASAGTISGPLVICAGNVNTLTSSVPGGTWSSSATSKATIGSATGIVTGVAAGTANITYRLVAGCETTATITVNSAIASVTGTNTVCPGGTTTFSNAAGGGSWSSSSAAIGTVDASTGVITAISGGTATISYIISSTGCYATRTLTVNPGTLTGNLTVCAGNTTTLTSTLSGGTWASGNTSVASVTTSTGVVTGVSAGTSTMTYTRSGCTGVLVVTVNAAVDAISGPSQLCTGSTVTLTNATSGGTWVSSTTSRCTIGSTTGIVTGVSSGTSRISYIVSSTCFATRVQTVSVAGSITGTAACLGATTTLSCTPAGGTWVSSSPSVVSIGSSSGVTTAAATGTSIITYTTPIGCIGTRTVTIDAVPAAITGGADSICTGSTMTFSIATSGGSWTSSNTAVATVGTSGLVTAVHYGTSSIRYTMPGGCYSERIVSVDLNPDPDYFLFGNNSIVENFYFYSIIHDSVDYVSGLHGVWSVSDTTIDSMATVNEFQAQIYGLTPGTAIVSYSVANSCGSHVYTKPVTVMPHVCNDVWNTEGGAEFSTTDGYGGGGTSVSIDRNGTPLVTYVGGVPYSSTTSVKRFDGVKLVSLQPVDIYSIYGFTSDAISFIGSDSACTPILATSYSGSVAFHRWQGDSWSTLGSYAGLSASSMTMGSDSRLYIGYSDAYNSGKATVVRMNGSGWDTIGTAGFTSGAISRPSITTAADGTIFLAFAQGGDTARVILMKYDGGSWVTVGTPVYEDPYYTGLNEVNVKIDASGVPYVAFTASYTGAGPLYVKKLSASGWVSLGSGAITSDIAQYVTLSIDPAGRPNVAYRDHANSDKATVSRYESGAWTALGGAGFSNAEVGPVGFAIDNNGTAFVSTWEGYQGYFYKYNGSTWVNVNGGAGLEDADGTSQKQMAMDGDTAYVVYESYYNKACVRKLVNGSWKMVGVPNFSSTAPQYLSLAVKAGTCYVAYKDASAANKVTVMRYNGSSWSALGGTGISAGAASYVEVAVDNAGAPYVSYRDAANGNKVTVLKYNGSAWNAVGSAGFSAGAAQAVSLAVTGSGTPFVSFADSLNGGMVTVMKYDGSAWTIVGAPGFGYPIPIGMPYDGVPMTRTSLKLDGNDTPYVAFYGGLYFPVFVRKFDGADWVSLTTYPDWRFASNTGISDFSFALSSAGVPYVAAYRFPGGGMGYNNTEVTTFNGYDWVVTGNVRYGVEAGAITMDQLAYIAAIAVDSSGVPYLAHRYSFADAGTVDMTFLESQVQFKKRGANIIRGNLSVCVGSHSYLKPERLSYLIAPGVWSVGSWSSSNTSVATVDTNGTVTGVSAGTATISYMYYDCPATVVVTVNALPSAGTLSGASSVAVGSTITLSSSTSGGTWSSSSDAFATVGSSSGVVTGVAAGTVTITYVQTGVCGLAYATRSVSVTAPRPALGSDGSAGAFTVYPNPSSGGVNILTAIAGEAVLTTVDGRVLARYEVAEGTTAIEIPNSLAHGVYVLRFECVDKTSKVAKLIYE